MNINKFQGKMVIHLAKEPSVRLLKHVVRCYLRLSDNQRFVSRDKNVILLHNLAANFIQITNLFLKLCRACEALQQCLPDQLRDSTFAACLQEDKDKATKHWLTLLIKNVDTYSINPRQVGISPLTS